MKNDFVMPILVLTLICLVISAALAVTNSVTAPIISTANKERAETARKSVIDSEDYIDLLPLSGASPTVREAYRASNGEGYIFMLTTTGYGGDLTIICGIDPDGKIISVKTLSAQNETKGMGSRVAEPDFEGQFTGKTKADTFDTISGATISSKAYIEAINDALAAFEIAKGAN